RYTPVFQTGIEGALPSCPSTESSLKVRRLLREVLARGHHRERYPWWPCANTSDHFTRREIPVSARTSQTSPRRFNSAFASRSLRTATKGCKHCSDAAVS